MTVDDYMLDKKLGKVKGIISIKKLDNTKILIGTFDKLPHDITLKNVLILITCVIFIHKYFRRNIITSIKTCSNI